MPAARQRLSEITQVAARHGFGYLFHERRFGLHPWRLTQEELDAGPGSERARRLREMLEELGPTFVKFGQLLSTRPDVVPDDIVFELRSLQDDVRPFPFAEVEQTIEAEFGLTVEQLFLEFDETAIAAASIGQVHRAVLPDGREVAVKVQRPAAPAQVEADLVLLYQAARFAGQRVKALRFIDTVGLVDEFARSIRQELDYRTEARNAGRFRANFARDPDISIPQIYPSYCGAKVLTLEFLHGVEGGRRPGARGRSARAPASRVPDRRDVDDDDLPPRLLPCGSASGERPRGRARAASGSSTSGRPGP